ncbi:MAG: DUF2089 domain-containing protein [Acidobacteriota bacterium]|nr:DUF2089 domain-containing protein [Acidobacteriota bacterium]
MTILSHEGPSPHGSNSWLELLGDEDRAFLKRFVLASGSLKKTAAAYGISYPTVRLRLDRVIAKIEVAEESRVSSRFERVLRAQYAEGKIEHRTLRTLLDAHREELEKS